MRARASGHPLLTVPSAPDHEPKADPSLIPMSDQSSVTLRPAGELDMTAAFRIEPEVDRLLAVPDVRRLVVDLAAVTFVDSAGLGTLLAVRERSADLGIELALVNPSAPVRRMLELSGTSAMLED